MERPVLCWITALRPSGWGIDIFTPARKIQLALWREILRHYKLIYKKEVTKMDEMNNMNETTMMENETSVEVVPEECVQVIDNEEPSGIDPKLVLGAAVIAGAAIVGGIKHLKSKKNKPADGKPKTKKKIHLRTPWTVTEEVEQEMVDNMDEDVEETSEEEN